jgi:hypothetical protein
MTPTVSTIAMGGISIALYAAMNYMSSGALVITDAVIAIGLFIAFCYGLIGFACAWGQAAAWRASPCGLHGSFARRSTRSRVMRELMHAVGRLSGR